MTREVDAIENDKKCEEKQIVFITYVCLVVWLNICEYVMTDDWKVDDDQEALNPYY